MKATSTTRRAAFSLSQRHLEEFRLLSRYAVACSNDGDRVGAYDFTKASVDHYEAYLRYADLCSNCAEGAEVGTNLAYSHYVGALMHRW